MLNLVRGSEANRIPSHALRPSPHRQLVISGSKCSRQGFDSLDKGVRTGTGVEEANGRSDAPLRHFGSRVIVALSAVPATK